MTISAQDLDHIAHLARLTIDPDQRAPLLQNLQAILTFVEHMNQADTKGVTPMAHPLASTLTLRDDAICETNQREHFQAQAPAVKNGLYLVPQVIE